MARDALLSVRLADERGNRVVFVSHCLLDENVRYLGGAFHSGAVPEMEHVVRAGIGICQMPCPEMRAWGGVHKRWMLRSYGLCETPLDVIRQPLLRMFRAYTRVRYALLARGVAREIASYDRAGVDVAAIVGIGASPSCGVTTTLDLRRSLQTVAGCPLAAIDRPLINRRAVEDCRVPGEGMFVRALRRRLRRRGIAVPFREHDLIAEMHGIRQPLELRRAPRARSGEIDKPTEMGA